ncbi:hypothetical protein MSHO_09940 [Mycobacterium shottsii]|uniref:Uncharacterized protein n=1 Tax=Mycobacterium shottsii TaxID=133549 RepID=A0A7I7L892_9MYCO|nr:hypothetical protein MSHO_09940 [Mycobacterium shottsii]
MPHPKQMASNPRTGMTELAPALRGLGGERGDRVRQRGARIPIGHAQLQFARRIIGVRHLRVVLHSRGSERIVEGQIRAGQIEQ